MGGILLAEGDREGGRMVLWHSLNCVGLSGHKLFLVKLDPPQRIGGGFSSVLKSLWNLEAWITVPMWPSLSCVTMDQSLNLSELHFCRWNLVVLYALGPLWKRGKTRWGNKQCCVSGFLKSSELGRFFCSFCSPFHFSEKLVSEVVTKRPNHSLSFKGPLNYLSTMNFESTLSF